jgi:integrase
MLTDTKCKTIRHQGKPQKISDGGGLYLMVTPTAKLWRMAYRFGGKQKTLSFGEYGDANKGVTLAAARTKRDTAKMAISQGIDPNQQKKEAKRPQSVNPTFGFVADEWFEAKVLGENASDSTETGERRRVKRLKAAIGDLDASKIEPRDVLAALRSMQKIGHHEEANRTRSTASRIFRYGIPFGYCVRDPAADLSAAMTKLQSKPRPALTDPATFGGLLRDIENYRGYNDNVTGLAMRLLPLVVTRPVKEFTLAQWPEFDFAQARWTIPKERLKEREGEHIVPLSRQALAILKQLHAVNSKRKFVFSLAEDKPISADTVNAALRGMGYDTKTQHCGHGFRTSFSTMLNKEYRADNEKVWHDDVIELQLAHLEGSTRRIYFRMGPDALWQPRSNLMQHWADKCDVMRDGGNVVPINKPTIGPINAPRKHRKVA